MVFNVVPTAFEVALVAGILAYKCGPAFAGLTAGTIVAYTAFTFSITQVNRTINRGVISVVIVGLGCWGGLIVAHEAFTCPSHRYALRRLCWYDVGAASVSRHPDTPCTGACLPTAR
jgi:hypothetical protein